MSRSADRHRSGFGAVASAIFLVFGLACAALFPSPASALEAHDYKMAGDAAHMRVVINFDREPDPRWFLLRSPHRLVIDLPKTQIRDRPQGAEGEGAGQERPLRPHQRQHLAPDPGGEGAVRRRQARHAAERGTPNGDSAGYRLVADISAASQRAFDEALGAAGADDRLDRGDAEERAAGPEDRPRRPALHHRHRPRPWRHRRRRGRAERHGRRRTSR